MQPSPSKPTHPQLDPETFGAHDGHVVYAMPAFLRLRASDPVATVRFFTDALDFDVLDVLDVLDAVTCAASRS